MFSKYPAFKVILGATEVIGIKKKKSKMLIRKCAQFVKFLLFTDLLVEILFVYNAIIWNLPPSVSLSIRFIWLIVLWVIHQYSHISTKCAGVVHKLPKSKLHTLVKEWMQTNLPFFFNSACSSIWWLGCGFFIDPCGGILFTLALSGEVTEGHLASQRSWPRINREAECCSRAGRTKTWHGPVVLNWKYQPNFKGKSRSKMKLTTT